MSFVPAGIPLSVADAYSLAFSDTLAWVVVAAFVLAAALEWRGVADAARYVGTGAWGVFAVFWLAVAPHFWYAAQSPLETLLSLAAVPLCLYTGYLLWEGRTSLHVLSRAVAFMGLIYLPVETIPFFRQWLIETTARQTHFGMELLGHSPGLSEAPHGYESRFDFDSEETVTGRTSYIVLACTGIGSMAIFGGLIAAVSAPLRRKVAAFALAVGIIWFLNLLRNVFVGLASPWGWFQFDPLIHVTTAYMGAPAEKTSFLVAHNFVSQPLSIVALIAITYVVVRVLPEVLDPLEEALFVTTGTEYDLADALGNQPVRADGAGDAGDGAVADDTAGDPSAGVGDATDGDADGAE